MSELLAPAGSMEALITAIHNGCDAIYLGMNRFGARAYANNFTIEELAEAVKYAHPNDDIYIDTNSQEIMEYAEKQGFNVIERKNLTAAMLHINAQNVTKF